MLDFMLEFLTPEDITVLTESAKAVMITLVTVGSGLLIRFITKLQPLALNWVESVARRNDVEVNQVALKSAMETLEKNVISSVDSVTQTFVKQVKKAGVWTEANKEFAKDMAVSDILKSLGQDTLKTLLEEVDNNKEKLENRIANLVESRVNMLKFYEVKNSSNE